MELPDLVRRDALQVGAWIEAVIAGAHIDVVDVQENAATRPQGDLGQELPLGEGRVPVGDVAGDVLQGDRPPKPLLHALHPLHHVVERRLGVRQRQKVVGVAPSDAGPAEMVGHPGGLEASRESVEPRQIGLVQRIGRSDGERHAVQHHGVPLAHPREHVERAAALDHEVLGERLEPVDGCGIGQDALEMVASQPDTVAEK